MTNPEDTTVATASTETPTASTETPTASTEDPTAATDDATSADSGSQNAPQTASGSDSAETGEDNLPESGSGAPQIADANLPDRDSGSAEGDLVGDDEEYLPPGQTEVPVEDEVVVDDDTMRRALEAILMVTDEPLPVLTLARAVGRPTGDISAALNTLAEEYTEQGRGFDLREVGGGWRYYTRVEAAPYVERFVLDGQQARLTQAALETLAVVAYKQPVSRARVSAIRGVNVDGVMRTLVARGLVEEAGADTESQATLYRTTTYFLERMGMQSLDDLPELAPYLPEMDDIEEELAAQTIPAPTEPPGADADTADTGERESEDQTDPGIDEDLDIADAGGLGVDGDMNTAEPDESGDAGIDGDLSSAGADDQDSGYAGQGASDELGELEGEAAASSAYDAGLADAGEREPADEADAGIDGDLDAAEQDGAAEQDETAGPDGTSAEDGWEASDEPGELEQEAGASSAYDAGPAGAGERESADEVDAGIDGDLDAAGHDETAGQDESVGGDEQAAGGPDDGDLDTAEQDDAADQDETAGADEASGQDGWGAGGSGAEDDGDGEGVSGLDSGVVGVRRSDG
ncbi:SMC-Scp complex subunit ScpB [Kribbella sp. NPDC050281]|uniref:SMC-Scp complex subunit ScpB n=1 Tax=Kribbella sp. NPDC050281 TaxID=3155515 RepID=UPI0033E11BA5